MPQQLTHNQQEWLDHVNQASEQNLSMSAYAKKNNLSLNAFYYARTALLQKGAIPQRENNPFIPMTYTNPTSTNTATSCRVTLINGALIDFSEVDLGTLLKKVSQL